MRESTCGSTLGWWQTAYHLALNYVKGGTGAVYWTMLPEQPRPDSYFPVTAGTLELAVAGSHSGRSSHPAVTGAAETGLVINEIAAQG